MTGSGLIAAAALGAAYLASLVLLLRWTARVEGSHVLAIGHVLPTTRRVRGLDGRALLFIVVVPALAAALLMLEAQAVAVLGGTRVSATLAPPGRLIATDGTLVLASGRPGREAAAAILFLAAALMMAARRLIQNNAVYPLAVLMTGLIAFGALADLASGSEGPARPQLAFRTAAGLQLTAAGGFIIGALVLRVRSMAVLMRGVLAHMAGAGARLLGVLTMLALWPALPRASAAALLVVLLLVPGVATTLAGATAMATPRENA